MSEPTRPLHWSQEHTRPPCTVSGCHEPARWIVTYEITRGRRPGPRSVRRCEVHARGWEMSHDRPWPPVAS